MIAYDMRKFYNLQKEPFNDPEWDAAMKINEPAIYYWVITNNGGRYTINYY